MEKYQEMQMQNQETPQILTKKTKIAGFTIRGNFPTNLIEN